MPLPCYFTIGETFSGHEVKGRTILDIEQLVAFVEAFGSATAQAERVRLLAHIRDQLQNLRTADEKSRAELEGALRAGVGAAEAERAALASREYETAAAKRLLPRIQSLQRYLTGTSLDDDAEAHQLLQDAVNIAAGYAAGHQNVRDQFIGFEAEEQAAAKKILYARPVAGEIDHGALSREFIARFPNIRAALAK